MKEESEGNNEKRELKAEETMEGENKQLLFEVIAILGVVEEGT